MLLHQFTSLISEQKETNSLTSVLKINANHQIFEGHFPGQPVTPGVILIQLFKEEAERFYSKSFKIEQTNQAKFLVVVTPQEDDEIELQSVFLEKEDQIQLTGKALQKNNVVIKLKLILKPL